MNYLDIREDQFDENFPDYGFTLRHNLARLPAFELPQLLELSRQLPADLEPVAHCGHGHGFQRRGHSRFGQGARNSRWTKSGLVSSLVALRVVIGERPLPLPDTPARRMSLAVCSRPI